MSRNEREIARYFDCCESDSLRKRNDRISAPARHALVRAIEAEGLIGRSVLEVGCGDGSLVCELVGRGAARATGIDLAEGRIDEASRKAEEENVSERVEFRIGNGAKDVLPQHDVVVLDKVICCYPYPDELVDNSIAAARSVYGFVIPVSSGVIASVIKVALALNNIYLRVRRCGFRAFVHDYREIDERIRSKGFALRHFSRGPIWMTAVYARAD